MKNRSTQWLVAAGAALAIVTTAAASNSASFADPAGDAASAPDVTSVVVSNNDAGTIAVKVGLGNRTALGPQDWLLVAIDTDLQEDAEGYLNPEYAITYSPSGTLLERREGENWIALPTPLLTAFGGSFQAGTATLTVNQTDLGDPTFVNFWLLGGTDADGSRDDAPDGNGIWEYRIVSPSLYVLAFERPKAAVAGKRFVASMNVRGAKQSSSRVVCAAQVAGKRVPGVASWFRIEFNGRTLSARPRCTWTAPKKAKGKLLRGTMSVVEAGVQVSRTFSFRVR